MMLLTRSSSTKTKKAPIKLTQLSQQDMQLMQNGYAPAPQSPAIQKVVEMILDSVMQPNI